MKTAHPQNRLLSSILGRAGRGPSVESLEPRQMLTAVSWDGGAFTQNWHDPLNWSNDAIPTVADDVTIPATALSTMHAVSAPRNAPMTCPMKSG